VTTLADHHRPAQLTDCTDRVQADARHARPRPASTPVAARPADSVTHDPRCPSQVAGESARGACLCGTGAGL